MEEAVCGKVHCLDPPLTIINTLKSYKMEKEYCILDERINKIWCGRGSGEDLLIDLLAWGRILARKCQTPSAISQKLPCFTCIRLKVFSITFLLLFFSVAPRAKKTENREPRPRPRIGTENRDRESKFFVFLHKIF